MVIVCGDCDQPIVVLQPVPVPLGGDWDRPNVEHGVRADSELYHEADGRHRLVVTFTAMRTIDVDAPAAIAPAAVN